MRKIFAVLLSMAILATGLAGCGGNSASGGNDPAPEVPVDSSTEDTSPEEEQAPNAASDNVDTDDVDTASGATPVADPDGTDAVTSASVVPAEIVSPYTPSGFTPDSGKPKALFVVGDPRTDSVLYDLAYTAMAHFEDQGYEVELRDLYAIGFNPVLPLESFYNAKDGFGETPEDVRVEQELVSQADHILFVYPNWHDTPNAIVKGYMERVFAKQFAYRDTSSGLEGLLTDKSIYTIMNCGYLGGGRGFIGDGVGISDDVWDTYMEAFKVMDDDTAGFWGVENRGRFVNDRTPANSSENYQEELDTLRDALRTQLDKDFFA